MPLDAVERVLDKNDSFRVTGVMMQYYVVCKRELWFEFHDVVIDREQEDIVRGTLVDEDSYPHINRERIQVGPIAPDMLDSGDIVEIKPSSKLVKSSRAQLLYYLWYFKHKFGVEKDGVLAFPTERTRTEVKLDEENEKWVKESIQDIYEIVNKDSPPEFEEKEVCSSCAFKDFCMIGTGDSNEG